MPTGKPSHHTDLKSSPAYLKAKLPNLPGVQPCLHESQAETSPAYLEAWPCLPGSPTLPIRSPTLPSGSLIVRVRPFLPESLASSFLEI